MKLKTFSSPPSNDPVEEAAQDLANARKKLADCVASRDHALQELRKRDPSFAFVLDELERVEAALPRLEERMKELARSAKESLKLGGRYGFDVNFTNPMKKVGKPEILLEKFPNARRDWPEVFVDRVELDLETLQNLIAAGTIPEEASVAVVSEPTSKNGRCELKYRD